ncbi:MAG: MaoC family dehydratase [bacterium]|nr:MaoC family dehydratase [bacterium]
MADSRQNETVPFDSIEPGDSVGEWSYRLTPELVDRHRRATQQAPYEDPELAPISILAADGVNLADRFWDISQSVHAGQQIEILGLPRIGDELRVTGKAREKFVKHGRRFVVSEVSTSTAAGEPIARGLTTGVIVYSEVDDDTSPKTRPPVEQPTESLATFGPLIRTMTHEAMVLYEPEGDTNLHTSDEVARAAGLPAAIATGTLFLAYVFDLLHQTYGPGSLLGVQLDTRIRLPVFAGDRIETQADVVAREQGQILHRVRCRGPHGDVIVGTASVREL